MVLLSESSSESSIMQENWLGWVEKQSDLLGTTCDHNAWLTLLRVWVQFERRFHSTKKVTILLARVLC